jgi:hypothetical protein
VGRETAEVEASVCPGEGSKEAKWGIAVTPTVSQKSPGWWAVRERAQGLVLGQGRRGRHPKQRTEEEKSTAAWGHNVRPQEAAPLGCQPFKFFVKCALQWAGL